MQFQTPQDQQVRKVSRDETETSRLPKKKKKKGLPQITHQTFYESR
jgi:hypothetical protein